MSLRHSARLALALSLALSATTWMACNKAANTEVSAEASTGGKIPITTKSEEARKEFLEGRSLSERLLGQESLAHFDKALELDPDFASAELARANNSPTAKEFFEHLKKAVGLADKVSEGERVFILSNEAAANGDVVKQEEALTKLVSLYPNDERVHFNLAGLYFGQQEWDPAVEHYKQATKIDPNYSPAYNVLGYAYRQQGDYTNAEQSFKKYIELIPNDPNPYDSYAELLLKMGRFEESIAQYHKALSIDPHFVPSHFGISANQMYMGKPAEANAELQKMVESARNDGETRTAYFGMAVIASDSGKFDQALAAMDKEYAVAEKKNDVAAMSADLQAKGNIMTEMGKRDEAKRTFERSLQLLKDSSLSQDIRDNAELGHSFNLAAVAIAGKDYGSAKTNAETFRQKAEASKNSAQVRQYHELAGRIALGEKDYDKAISELAQSNLQNPANLYRMALAYQGKGDNAKVQDYGKRAAEFDSLPQLPYAFIRTKAEKLIGKKA